MVCLFLFDIYQVYFSDDDCDIIVILLPPAPWTIRECE